MKTHIAIIILIAGMVVLSGCVEDTSVDSMIEDLGSENTSVKINAMDSLVKIGDESTIRSLIQVMENKSETIEKRENTVVVLGRIGDNETADVLLNIAMDEEEEKGIRMASILALGDIGNETALKSLWGLSYGDDGLILYHAAYVLNQLEGSYEVFATYGELPYPLSDEQRLYRNNVYEISRASRNNSIFPTIENATSVLIGYNSKSGYIDVLSDVRPKTSVMDEIYQIYDNEAKKRGVNQVPVRFVHAEATLPYYYYPDL
ncbi:HEAT repeat domain-containing protein [Methanolobus psychrotolerans]|uniref:HEAT repeat domain-containing protein n=1 Tax=Methanolobus psychrotolerans TaxID=1874706 RepID=UPI0013EBC7EB|nr:HEAT repeat domain-containing protein [Methanolobus psychrotolerans]